MHVKFFLVTCTAAVAFTSAANPPVQQQDFNTPVPASYRCSLSGACTGKNDNDEVVSQKCYKEYPHISEYVECCKKMCPTASIRPHHTCRGAGIECGDRDGSASVFCRASSTDWINLSDCCSGQCEGSAVPAFYQCPNVGYTCDGADDVAAVVCHSREKTIEGFTGCCSQTCLPIPSFVRGH